MKNKIKVSRDINQPRAEKPMIVHKYISVSQRRRPEKTVLLQDTEIQKRGNDFNGVFYIDQTDRRKGEKVVKG